VDRGPQCRRCRADLSLLFTLEAQRRQALTAAQEAAARGQWQRALAIADGADALRKDGESQRLLAVCHLLRRDFARAWKCYTEAMKANS
jgi:hypothetical protein